jgi:hypothetical protein
MAAGMDQVVVVGRVRFELTTYGLRERGTPALMDSKVKNLQSSRFWSKRAASCSLAQHDKHGYVSLMRDLFFLAKHPDE